MCPGAATKQYTQLITTNGKQHQWAQSLHIFMEMAEQRIQPDIIALNATISACSAAHSWRFALDLFATVRRFYVTADVASYNATIGACTRGQMWQSALQVFSDMKLSSIRMDIITYTSLISACSKGQLWREAIACLVVMESVGLGANNVTFGAAIDACGKAKQWMHALRLLGHMRCARIQADRITYNASISSCEKGKSWTGALFLLQEMQNCCVTPDTISYSASISACGKGNNWMGALTLLIELNRFSRKVDCVAFNATISACEKQTNWNIALSLLEEMLACCGVADTVTYNATISACGKAGLWKLAMSNLDRMQKSRIHSNAITYSAVITACEKGSQWRLAVHMLASMAEVSVEANTISYYAAMHACEVCHQWEFASVLLTHMLDQQIEDCALVDNPYRHVYQAGSTLDCFKHVVLVMLLEHMISHSDPFTYVDTHAGAGIYDLDSSEALLFKRSDEGFLRLQKVSEERSPPWPIAQYLATVQSFTGNSTLKSHGMLRYYLGSPAIAQQWLRPQDTAVLFEKHLNVYTDLLRSLKWADPISRKAMRAIHEDSYRSLLCRNSTHKFSGRGLVLIDPPYDSYDSYTAWNVLALSHFRNVWPSACIVLWYPARDVEEHASFIHRIRALELGDVIVAEFVLESPDNALLGSSGMLLVNPPHEMFLQLKTILSTLATLLAPGPLQGTSNSTLYWL